MPESKTGKKVVLRKNWLPPSKTAKQIKSTKLRHAPTTSTPTLKAAGWAWRRRRAMRANWLCGSPTSQESRHLLHPHGDGCGRRVHWVSHAERTLSHDPRLGGYLAGSFYGGAFWRQRRVTSRTLLSGYCYQAHAPSHRCRPIAPPCLLYPRPRGKTFIAFQIA
mgnify:CR=1 FL=1